MPGTPATARSAPVAVTDRERLDPPEFVQLLEDLFEMHGLWGSGSLAALRSVLHEGMESMPETMWEACEQLRSVLSDLPARVGAPNVASFVTGSSPSQVLLLSSRVQDLLIRWHAWLTELYTLALSVTTPSPSSASPPTAVPRLHELVYSELDPFLAPRVRHWAERRRLLRNDPPPEG